MTTLSGAALAELCTSALLAVGAGRDEAAVLADATVEAELVGNRAVGVAHLFDYLSAYREGRIRVDAEPLVTRPAPSVLDVDADDGLAQVAFIAASAEFEELARTQGIAALWIKNSFTCGELGYYARRLAGRGLLAVTVANSPALMSIGGAPTSIVGTNPLAYGIPRAGRLPVVIDQASSATAYVNIRRAAETGESIPAGWALGPDGAPTEDALAAVQGTLLPFGGHRGGNIALLVELLATLSGASFSSEAAPFDTGTESPRIGVFLMAIDPTVFGAAERLASQLGSLADRGVRLPAVELTTLPDTVDVADDLLGRLRGEVSQRDSSDRTAPE